MVAAASRSAMTHVAGVAGARCFSISSVWIVAIWCASYCGGNGPGGPMAIDTFAAVAGYAGCRCSGAVPSQRRRGRVRRPVPAIGGHLREKRSERTRVAACLAEQHLPVQLAQRVDRFLVLAGPAVFVRRSQRGV